VKTRELSKLMVTPFPQRHLSPDEKQGQYQDRVAEEEKATRERVGQMVREKLEHEARFSGAVQEVIDRMNALNLMWRDMKFHHLRKDNQDWVEVIDRINGEVLKVLPQPDYNKLANHFKQHPGLVLDITT